MGAISMGLPFIYLPAGPMLRGNWKGRVLGSGSDAFKFWDERRAGRLGEQAWREMEAGIARSHGTCMTMGTAATMMGIAEAVGLALPGASSIPAADANHIRMSAECGRRIVEMVHEDLTPARMLTRAHFENGIACAMAIGCSTNAIIHLIAMSRRAGHAVSLDDFDAFSRRVPVVANIRPSGDTYLMEDFFYAGGLRALLQRIRVHLKTDAMTVNGKTLGENIAGSEVYDEDVIRPLANPIYAEGALAVLRGNLAPGGVVIKPSACAPHLLQHTGRALVFDDYPSLKRAVEDPDLDVNGEDILVLRNAGPKGAGMPEWGMLPIPTRLLKQGVKDMLRLSDARMSGTSSAAACCTARPNPPWAGRWPWCARATASRWTCRPAASTCKSATKNWPPAALPGHRRLHATNAATAGCSGSISCRPTRDVISIFWRRISGRRFRSRIFFEKGACRMYRAAPPRRTCPVPAKQAILNG
jgi:dihydroxy-acid dehydratase